MYKKGRVPITNELTPNEVLDRGKFHVSYCARVADYGSVTTAIVLKNTVFLILNGDHRKRLEEVSEKDGLQGCFDYFLEHLGRANHMSEHHQILAESDRFEIASNSQKFLGDENIERLKQAAKDLEETAVKDAETKTEPETEDSPAP